MSAGGQVDVAVTGEHADAAANMRPSRAQQLTTFFRNPEFLRFVGGTLKTTNVLDYFATSDFYERSCNNAVLAMQGGGAAGVAANAAAQAATAAGEPQHEVARIWEEKRSDPALLESELRRFVGLEFVLAHAKPPDLFVIHKRWRTSATETSVLEAYYVLHGNVHMAGDLFTVLGSRLLSATTALSSSLSLARNAQPDFNAREGYAWRIAAEKQPVDDDDEEDISKTNAREGPGVATLDDAGQAVAPDMDVEAAAAADDAPAMPSTAPNTQPTAPTESIIRTRRQSRDENLTEAAVPSKRRRGSKAAI